MNLKALLDKQNITTKVNIESRKRLVEFVVSRLANTIDNLDEDEVIKSIYKRQRLGTTYIGKNIYMFHCRVPNLRTTKIVITTLKKSYFDYQAKADVNMAVAVFFPEKITDIHFQLLKRLASFLKKDETQQKLKKVSTASQLYDLIMVG